MKILVCGGRDIDESQAYHRLLRWWVESKILDIEIIQGGARGADRAAKAFANNLNFKQQEFPADWKKYGKSAGMIRNRKMLTEGKPDVIVALPGGRGTEGMKKIGREAGIKVIELEID